MVRGLLWVYPVMPLSLARDAILAAWHDFPIEVKMLFAGTPGDLIGPNLGP
jgi:hypothetical protein